MDEETSKQHDAFIETLVKKGLAEDERKPEDVKDDERLTALLNYLLPLRDETVKYREGSGIEDVWNLCEERYNGIDDANRSEFKQLKLVKPTVMNAPLTSGNMDPRQTDEIKSTVFVRLTSRYVDAASAKIAELLLSDEMFFLTPTPVQELEDGKKDETPVMDEQTGQPLMRKATPQDAKPLPPGAAMPAEGQEQPEEVPITTKDLVEERYQMAHKSCKKAERRIKDWYVESKHNKEMRRVIFDSARLGVGVVKGPYAERYTRKKVLKGDKDEAELKIVDKIAPATAWRDPWNIFPDKSCGDQISNGDFIFERDYLSVRRVRKLKNRKGYIKDQIDKIIEEGPNKKMNGRPNPSDDIEQRNKDSYEVWYFTGTIDRSMFEAANPEAASLLKEDQDEVFAIVTIINDKIVRATLNPLNSGRLNYHSIPWTFRGSFWAGIGPNEQMSTPQKVCNGAMRAMLNNAGVSSGGQIVIDQEAVVPANGDWRVAPNKIWYKTSDGVIDDVRKAFTTFEIPERVDQLLKIIEFSMRLAEESTNIPLVTQGQSGDTTPNTLGATDIQNNNANQLLRDVADRYDDYINEPLVDQHFEWLLLDPDVPDEEKDEWTIKAHVSRGKVERSIQDQTLQQILPLATDPNFEINPKLAFAAFMKSKKIEPKDIQYTEEEIQKIRSTPPPPDKGVQIAQIKAQIAQQQSQSDQQIAQAEMDLQMQIAQLNLQSKEALEKLRDETARLKVKLDTDRDTIYVETQRAKAQADYQHALKKLELERELALMEYASKHEITLEQVKAKLAETAMKLRTQKEISAAGFAVDVHKNRMKDSSNKGRSLRSPIEIPGTAPKGQGFQK